jgi:citrate lyase gamma subunit
LIFQVIFIIKGILFVANFNLFHYFTFDLPKRLPMTSVIKKFIVCFFVVISFTNKGSSQQERSGSLNEGPIQSQFDYLNDVSNNFQEYKVVKKDFLERIKNNVLDSLKNYKIELGNIQQQIVDNNELMKSFEEKMAENEKEMLAIQEARDSFSVGGININKARYQIIVLSIIAGLTLISIFFIYKYYQSFKIIKLTQKDLEETLEEFDQHRKNTVERERKLKRELIDAMNGKVN